MKRIKLLVFLCGLTFAVSCGQQKRYVSYKVKEGESIRDIAERLSMEEEDLLRLNPDVNSTPKANTVIVIPNQNITRKTGYVKNTPEKPIEDSETVIDETTTSSESSTENNDDKVFKTIVVDYKTHTVEAGETVYRITKMYNVSKEELMAYNPEFPDIQFNKISVGQVLKVQKIEKEVSINKEEVINKYVTHEIKSKETVFSLTRFYNVTKEDLVKLNPEYPEIANNNLQVGQLIKIRPINTEENLDEKNEESKTIFEDNIAIDRALNIAILLPFRASEYDSISNKDIFKRNRVANMVTDYYMGAEMAIDSIRKKGIVVNVNVFDTGKKGIKINSITSNNNLNDVDAIVGPFYSNAVMSLAKEVNTPIIFPHYSSKQKNFNSKKIITTAPSKDVYVSYLSSYLKEKYNGETIFVVNDGSKKSRGFAYKISTNLKSYDSIKNVISLTPNKDGYIKKEKFTNAMKPDSKSWVILTSDNNVAVANALNSMIGLPEGATVRVFALDKNKAYDKIDNYNLANVNFTFVTETFGDDNESQINNFNTKYLEKNNALPSDYSVKGFDTTYDVLMRLASGKNLEDTFNATSFRLENKFDYKNNNNQGLYIVKFNKDLSLERVK